MNDSKSQDIFLKDYSNSKTVSSFSNKKSNNMLLAKVYKDIYENTQDNYWLKRSQRLEGCSTFLKFRFFNHDTDTLKLKKINSSCRVRLCPVCAWRRGLKIFSHALKIFTYLENNENYSNKYDYLMLTLTVRNCQSSDLSSTIDWLMKSFDKLMKRRELKRVVKGWYRGLEITHNHNAYSRSYDTYHPHYHIILCVNRSYLAQHGEKVGYLSKEKWLQLWRECTGDYSITQVDVREISVNKRKKERLEKLDTSLMTAEQIELEKRKTAIVDSTCEVVKYAVKDSDYLIKWNWDLTIDVVQTLDLALKKRRLIAWGGVLKDIHKLLNLDDEVDGDLTNIDDDTIKLDDVTCITDVSAFWHVGYSDYVIYKVQDKSVEEALADDNQEKFIDRAVRLNSRKDKHFNLLRQKYDSVSDVGFEFELDENETKVYETYVATLKKKSILDANEGENSDLQLEIE